MFEEILDKYPWDIVKERIYNTSKKDVISALNNPGRPENFSALFSPAADSLLEELAVLSRSITRKRFGNIIQLFAPLYISNKCGNSCVYCGFNRNNKINRITLSEEQIKQECDILYRMGFRHILLLTGEDRSSISPEKLSEIARQIHHKFASVSIEVYPFSTEEYSMMAKSGVDGLTLFQETYNRIQYAAVHPAGMKKNYSWRVNAPDRAGEAGIRKIGLGVLLGLSDWRVDSFFCALHAFYLSKKYWKSQMQISFPRLRESHGHFVPPFTVSDRDLTHLVCAMRIIQPDAGLVMSTRETPGFRDNILPLGITIMSAGSKTEPGGYAEPDTEAQQFTVHDDRTPGEIAEIISARGLDPVWKDWDMKFLI